MKKEVRTVARRPLLFTTTASEDNIKNNKTGDGRRVEYVVRNVFFNRKYDDCRELPACF